MPEPGHRNAQTGSVDRAAVHVFARILTLSDWHPRDASSGDEFIDTSARQAVTTGSRFRTSAGSESRGRWIAVSRVQIHRNLPRRTWRARADGAAEPEQVSHCKYQTLSTASERHAAANDRDCSKQRQGQSPRLSRSVRSGQTKAICGPRSRHSLGFRRPSHALRGLHFTSGGANRLSPALLQPIVRA